jgi:RNA polymerase sigma-70 factor (ECF subfamily)
MVRAEAMVSVQRALDTLDLEHRAVFVLFELAGESCEEIAAALRISLGTVHSRLHAARIKFKKAARRDAVIAVSQARWKENYGS